MLKCGLSEHTAMCATRAVWRAGKWGRWQRLLL